jgi:2,4-dienoyl-CoA reductase-like NADH-dependent reductase (Old Yellow Enzyme family)
MTKLFEPWTLRGQTFRNRIFVSPMCEYSALEGLPTDWHLVHLGSRAVGGAGLVMTEATAVNPEGRISPGDTGIWSQPHADAFGRIAAFIRDQGAVPGIQLAHAGRKGSTEVPWRGGKALTGADAWVPVAPSALRFSDDYPLPAALDAAGIAHVVQSFVAATRFALGAGFGVIELHFAHGYLVHEFLSPLSNQRTDSYGGPLENRARLAREIAQAVRAAWPSDKPLFARLSCTDWVEGGFEIGQATQVAKWLQADGVDVIDCSSGGNSTAQKIPVGPGYQVPFARAIRQAGVPTAAVGLITDPHQAEAILKEGDADAVFLARELLRSPYWPLAAAKTLGEDVTWPVQYARAK